MATRVYGINRGQNLQQVSEGVGAAMVGSDIELSFDLTKNLSTEDLIEAIEKFKAYIASSKKWPPA